MRYIRDIRKSAQQSIEVKEHFFAKSSLNGGLPFHRTFKKGEETKKTKKL
jgi:hypothetical protein